MSLATDLQLLGSYRTHVEIISGLKDVKDKIDKNEKLKNCVKGFLTSPKQIMDLAERLIMITGAVNTVGSVLSGYGAGKLIDTNNNPSALKTVGTSIGASVVSGVVTVGSAVAVIKFSDLSKLEKDCEGLEKEMEGLHFEIARLDKDDTFKLLDHLKITPEQKDNFIEVMSSAIKNIKRSITIYLVTNAALMGAAGYHGYKRSGMLSAVGFFLLGSTGVGLGLAQGFAKPIKD